MIKGQILFFACFAFVIVPAALPPTRADCPPEPAQLTLLAAAPDETCTSVGDAVIVTLSMSCLDFPVSGYQAFLSFDPAVLAFESGAYNLPAPFGIPLLDPIQAVDEGIDLAAGVHALIGQPPTIADAMLATLNFLAIGEGEAVIAFRPHVPPTRLIAADDEILPALIPSSPILISPSCGPLPGDMNCDGAVTPGDIAGFVLALTNPGLYDKEYPGCDLSNADTNGDGTVSPGDIAGFVVLLTGA